MPVQPDDASWLAIGPKVVLAIIALVGSIVSSGLYVLLGVKAKAAVALRAISNQAVKDKNEADIREREQKDALETGRNGRLTAEILRLETRAREAEKQVNIELTSKIKGWDLARGQRRDYEELAKDFNHLIALFGKLIAGVISPEAAGMVADQFTPIALPLPPLEDARRVSSGDAQ